MRLQSAWGRSLSREVELSGSLGAGLVEFLSSNPCHCTCYIVKVVMFLLENPHKYVCI